VARGIVIAGSTGSVGRQALDVARICPEDLRIVGLAGGQNVDLLAKQVQEWSPRWVSAPGLRPGSDFLGARVLTLEGLCTIPDAERVLISTVGSAGLHPTLAALRAGKSVALANKEVLVMAGEIVVAEARRYNAPIIPVDSEHNALWQCLSGDCDISIGATVGPIERVVLTASGGAFRDYPPEDLANVSREQALAHPNWVMGRKVTIDSATLMNKGFEVIEAHWLFGLPYDKIDVVLHRESLVHAMVEFVDGSIRATLGPTDMRLPIQHALLHPTRRANPWPRLRLEDAGRLTFAPLPVGRYPCFESAISAGRSGGSTPIVLAAADDVAVQAFLNGQIAFSEIPGLVDEALQSHVSIARPSLEDVLEVDARTRSLLAGRLARRP